MQHEAKCNFSPPTSLSSGFFSVGFISLNCITGKYRKYSGNKAFDFISRYGLLLFLILTG